MFRDIVLDLLKKLKHNEDAFIEWIQTERRRYLREPALRL